MKYCTYCGGEMIAGETKTSSYCPTTGKPIKYIKFKCKNKTWYKPFHDSFLRDSNGRDYWGFD